MNALHRVIAALCVGGIVGFGSEMLFYSTPETALGPLDLAWTWAFYALAAYACLGVAAWLGLRDWLSVFLLGCILGWLVEGVVVATVYDALPYTIPFTAMSWHGLISVLLVFAGVRRATTWPLGRHLLFLLALGAFFGVWGQFWQIERQAIPPDTLTYAYLCGLGLIVPLGNMVLDRLPPVYPFARLETVAIWVLFALWWGVQMGTTLNPFYLVLPLAILPTLALLRARRGDALRLTRRPAPPWRHALFMIVPALSALVATQGWRHLDPIESNWPIALLTSGIALALYLYVLLRTLRRAP